ncbi:MAG: beta-galactosidase [bacterium]
MKNKKLAAFATPIVIFSILFVLYSLYSWSVAVTPKDIVWGVNFSQKHARQMGLNWQDVYRAIINDLKMKNIKTAVHWDLIEPKEGQYDFRDLDWQIELANKANVKITPIIGIKTSRWPECHLPDWARDQSKGEQQEAVLKLITQIVTRYRESPVIKYWQVENEPFLKFGVCPWIDEDFLKKEVALVHSLDEYNPVMITDSGEWSLWFRAARTGDIVGSTMYRRVWISERNTYAKYIFPPLYYRLRVGLIKTIFNKSVICGELQAEPWGPRLLYDVSLEEQNKTMNLEYFRDNIRFARSTGMAEFYLWGSEWWYFMKEKGYPEIWEEAKLLFDIKP